MNQLIENSIDIEQKWGKDHFPLSICRQKEAMKQIIHFQLCKIMCAIFFIHSHFLGPFWACILRVRWASISLSISSNEGICILMFKSTQFLVKRALRLTLHKGSWLRLNSNQASLLVQMLKSALMALHYESRLK